MARAPNRRDTWDATKTQVPSWHVDRSKSASDVPRRFPSLADGASIVEGARLPRLPLSSNNNNAQAHACEIAVAAAAPATFQPHRNMRTGSNTTFIRPANKAALRGGFVSPRPRQTPSAANWATAHGNASARIRAYVSASACRGLPRGHPNKPTAPPRPVPGA